MTDPLLVVEVALANAPNALDADLIWTDLSDRVRSIPTLDRGQSQELELVQPGTLTVVFSNGDRALDPKNLNGPYVDPNGTQIRPNKRIRVRAVHTGFGYDKPIFEGYINSWSQSYNGPNDATTTVVATDGFKVFAKASLPTGPFGIDIATTNPTYWWRLDEPVGSTQAFDSINGDVMTKSGSGLFGEQGLLSFDSSTAYKQEGGSTTDGLRSSTAVIKSADTTNQRLNFSQTGPGGPNQVVTSPDHAGLDGLGALDVRVRAQMPATGSALITRYYFGKGDGTTNPGVNRGYDCEMVLATDGGVLDGYLRLVLTGSTGTVQFPYARTVNGGGVRDFVDFTPGEVRDLAWTAAYSGSGNIWNVNFYTKTGGNLSDALGGWTQLGVTQTVNLGSSTLAANALLPAVGGNGALDTSTFYTSGGALQEDIYAVEVRSSVGGTVIADPTFTDTGQGWAIGDDAGDTGTDSTGKVWTIRTDVAGFSPLVIGATAAFTAMALVQYEDDGLTSNRTILQQGSTGGTPNYWSLYMDSSGAAVFQIVQGANTGQVSSNVVINDGEIHHVVALYSTTGVMKIYVDGLDATASGDTQLATMTVDGISIGQAYPSSSGSNWPGTIDEVLVYNRSLASSEITPIYDATVQPWQGDTSGERIEKILDAISWPVDRRDIDTGDSVLQAGGFGSDALSLMQLISQSELPGKLFMAKDGSVRFISRSNQYGLTPVAAFSDVYGTDNGFQALGSDYGDYLLKNDVTIQREDGKAQRARDLNSIAENYPVSYELTGLQHDSDELSLAAATKFVEQYGQPFDRIQSLTINPRFDPDVLFPLVLDLELGDWITVEITPQGVGDPILETYVIERISHAISNGQKNWVTTLNLSPAPVGIDPVDVITGDSPAPEGFPVNINTIDNRVTRLETHVDTIESTLDEYLDDTGWIEVGSGGSAPAFENSWTSYGSGWATCAFRKIGKEVHIKGLVKSGSVNTTIFTLPSGYRPAEHHMFANAVNSRSFGSTVSLSGFTAGTNLSPHTTSTNSSHNHTVPSHQHNVVGGSISGTASGTILDIGMRFDVLSDGTVRQVGGGANGYQAIFCSFLID